MDCNKQVPGDLKKKKNKEEERKKLKYRGNIWALTKIYVGFEFGKHVRLNQLTVSVTTMEYML